MCVTDPDFDSPSERPRFRRRTLARLTPAAGWQFKTAKICGAVNLGYLSFPTCGQKNVPYYEKAEAAFAKLFDAARAKDELQFALSLMSEFRGSRDAGWSSAEEADRAFGDYLEFLCGPSSRLKLRVALGFYCHLAEASGFYEIPKNMLGVAEGIGHSITPFSHLVEQNRVTGNEIAPNANKVIKDLAGHAKNIGHNELAEVFRDAFDPDLRNAYAHADFVVWNKGIRLNLKLGIPREVPFADFEVLLERGLNFFHLLRQIVDQSMLSYSPPRKIAGRLGDGPIGEWTIACDPEQGIFDVSGGVPGPAPQGGKVD